MAEQLKLRSAGERFGANTTRAMKQFKFPVFEGEKFMPEGIVWNRLSLKYKTRFINEPLRIFEALEGGLTANNVTIRMKSPRGASLHYFELTALPVGYIRRAKAAINYVRFSLHGKLFKPLIGNAFKSLLIFILVPAGGIFYMSDRIKYRCV